MRAHPHHQRPDHSQQHGGSQAHHRSGRQRAQHVFQQPLHALRENIVLARLGVITLHHAHAGKRFRQPPAHLRGDFRALAKNRTDHAERLAQRHHAHQHQSHRHQRHHRADAQEHHQRDDRRQQAAQKFHQTRADQVADAFDVVHDSRNQRARLVLVVIGDGQPAYVLLHFAPQLGDHALCGLGKRLRQCIRRHALNHRGQQHRANQRQQQIYLPPGNDVVDQIFGRIRQHQPGNTVHHHQRHAHGQQPAPGTQQRPHVRQLLQ